MKVGVQMDHHIPVILSEEYSPHEIYVSTIVESFSLKLNKHKKDIKASHRHDFHEFFWFTAGEGTMIVDFEEYAIQTNMLCHISPGQVHSLRFNEDKPLEGVFILIKRELLAGNWIKKSWEGSHPILYKDNCCPVYYADEEHTVLFNGLFQYISLEYKYVRLNRESAIYHYLQIMLIELDRMADPSINSYRDVSGYQLSNSFLQLVELYNNELSSVSQYAALLHVTSNHLIEMVKASLGKSAGSIIKERKIFEAKRMLCYSDLSVQQIAEKLHFKDASYFSRYFRKATNQAPRSFRKQAMQSE